MFENKKVNIIISFIVAICLWGYVIGETNPQDSKSFREIPISYINEEVLEDSGLVVLETSASTINVTVSGTRAEVQSVTANDITASVNLADAAIGENQLKIDVKVPDNVDVEEKSLNKVTVTVEEKLTKEVDIRPVYQGSFEEEKEPITIDMSQYSVTVSGAASQVEKVDFVKAVVETGSVAEELKTIEGRLIPVDEKGVEVNNVTLSEETVNISAELAKTKTVPLNITIIDRTEEQFEKSTSAPKTVEIKGKADDLAGIDSISAEPIDISEVTENTKLEIVPILPEDVQLSSKSSETMKLSVAVVKIESKTFEFDSDAITVKGLDEGLETEFADEKISITVTGAINVLNEIQQEDFVLSVNLKNKKEGNYRVELTVKCEKKYASMAVEPETIEIIIIEAR